MRRRYEERLNASKALESILEILRNGFVLVEGEKDAASLGECGINAVPVSGRPLSSIPAEGEIIILTDLDEAGDELAKILEMEFHSRKDVRKVDSLTRKKIGGLLNLVHFENFSEKLEKTKKELEV
jgi:5S rRNA maturation endonuclease (ribonuclease M5)